jgi:hypothetical protein
MRAFIKSSRRGNRAQQVAVAMGMNLRMSDMEKVARTIHVGGVGGLGDEIQEQDMAEFFGQYGTRWVGRGGAVRHLSTQPSTNGQAVVHVMPHGRRPSKDRVSAGPCGAHNSHMSLVDCA